MINDKIIEKEPIVILDWRCHFRRPVFINVNPIERTPIVNKVKLNNKYTTSVLKIGRDVLLIIEDEVNIIKIIEVKIVVSLFEKLINIGNRLRNIAASAELNIKIKTITTDSCNIITGLKNDIIAYIPITTNNVNFSGFVTLRTLEFIMVI